MKEPRRLQDEDPIAAQLLGAARSFKPSARARRLTLRALGLPFWAAGMGSVFASVTTATSAVKGWLLMGALTIATTGGVVYQVREHVSKRERVSRSSKQNPRPVAVSEPRAPRPAPPVEALEAPTPLSNPLPPPAAQTPTVRSPQRHEVKPNLLSRERIPRAHEDHRVTPVVFQPRELAELAANETAAPETAPLPPSLTALGSQPEVNHLTTPEGVALPGGIPASATRSVRAATPGLQPSERVAIPSASQRARMGLADEVQSVRVAYEALSRREAQQALARLDEYDSRHPTGELKDEAAVLRVAALRLAGKPDQARQLGEAFLRAKPHSLLANRMREQLKGIR